MDERKALALAQKLIRENGNGLGMDEDDLVQEIMLAELEGREPVGAVVSQVRQAVSRRTCENEERRRMVKVTQPTIGETDEELDRIQELEREQELKKLQELWANVEVGFGDLIANEVIAIKMFHGIDGGEPGCYQRIQEALNTTRPQAIHLVRKGLKKLKAACIKAKVKAPLLPGGVNEVKRVGKTYARGKGHFVRKEKDLFITEGAA